VPALGRHDDGTQWVSILVDGNDMHADMSQPEAVATVPGGGVIVEAFGVRKPIQEVTDRLFREAYAAVAPVLYHRLSSNPLFHNSGEDAEARSKVMEGSGIKVDAGATHEFHCDARPRYRVEALRDAWGCTRSWFQRYLQDRITV
jgi:dienelactone hydrolase